MALPMPTKRRSTYVQSPIETRTPPGRTGGGSVLQRGPSWISHSFLFFFFFCPDSSSGSEDETPAPRQSSTVAPPPPHVNPHLQSPESWINRTVQGSSTSSSASSTLSHGEAKSQPPPQPQPQPQYKPQYQPLYQPHYQPQYQQQEQPHTAAVTNMLAHSRIGEAAHYTLLLLAERNLN